MVQKSFRPNSSSVFVPANLYKIQVKHFIDCEFDGFGGPLISFAIVPEWEHTGSLDGMYFILRHGEVTPWVAKNVIPNLHKLDIPYLNFELEPHEVSRSLAVYLNEDPSPTIIADWPEDIAHFCRLLLPRPGYMVNVPDLKFEIARIPSYPSDIVGLVQHNSHSDARALRRAFEKQEEKGND